MFVVLAVLRFNPDGAQFAAVKNRSEQNLRIQVQWFSTNLIFSCLASSFGQGARENLFFGGIELAS